MLPPFVSLIQVELTREELLLLLALVKTRRSEHERMVQNLEEQEGMDLPRHRLLKEMRPQGDSLSDLEMKLEGAAAR